MAKVSIAPGWQRAVVILTGTMVGVVVIACLYWAQVVFIPVALAVFLTFLLAPPALPAAEGIDMGFVGRVLFSKGEGYGGHERENRRPGRTAEGVD